MKLIQRAQIYKLNLKKNKQLELIHVLSILVNTTRIIKK